MSIFMKVVGKVRKWRNWGLSETEVLGQSDWRDLAILSQEIMPKRELDDLQTEVLAELDRVCASATSTEEQDIATKPQSLVYCYKYIDAKFDKNTFDLNQHYLAKQNVLDQKYAEGLGDIELELSEYIRKSRSCTELGERLNSVARKLAPEVTMKTERDDKSEELTRMVGTLPQKINWC